MLRVSLCFLIFLDFLFFEFVSFMFCWDLCVLFFGTCFEIVPLLCCFWIFGVLCLVFVDFVFSFFFAFSFHFFGFKVLCCFFLNCFF